MRCFSGEHLRARSTYLRLRLQLLLHLQLVHLPEELLEQLAPFRADALFQFVHDLVRRHNSISILIIGFPSNNLRQRHRAAEICLRILLG